MNDKKLWYMEIIWFLKTGRVFTKRHLLKTITDYNFSVRESSDVESFINFSDEMNFIPHLKHKTSNDKIPKKTLF